MAHTVVLFLWKLQPRNLEMQQVPTTNINSINSHQQLVITNLPWLEHLEAAVQL